LLTIRDRAEYLAFLQERRSTYYPEIEAQVRDILERVRREGDEALHDLTARFEKANLRSAGFAVTQEEWDAADAAVSEDFRAAMAVAVANIRSFHLPQVPNSWFQTRPDGTVLGQRVTAVDRVGVYIPGGQAPLFSCLLMIVIPARIAGVGEILLCTPPNAAGRLDSHMLAAARAAGVDRVFKVGGAQAIGAMAYGTATIPRVDKIVGPGNYYVTMAKKLVFGPVGIDMLAGPTEVAVIDDGTAPVEWLAADLVSQAEHPDGTAILVTTAGEERIRSVGEAIARQVKQLRHRDTIVRSLVELGAGLTASSLEDAAGLVNEIAPEHLELEVTNPWAVLPLIRHAGSVFMGRWTPEAIGDYLAGPSNVIPTEGTPRYAYPVGVETFLKRTAVVSYTRQAFEAQAAHAVRLAEAEGLPAHAAALTIRMKGEPST
jgi:histidinol dehydrogenase